MATSVVIKNVSNLHTIKLRPETGRHDKNKKLVWEHSGVDGYIPPGQSLDVWVDALRRVIIEEVPT